MERENKSLIARSKVSGIERNEPPKKFREESEILSAYAQVGETPNRSTKSWYREIYEFYQNNEC